MILVSQWRLRFELLPIEISGKRVPLRIHPSSPGTVHDSARDTENNKAATDGAT